MFLEAWVRVSQCVVSCKVGIKGRLILNIYNEIRGISMKN